LQRTENGRRRNSVIVRHRAARYKLAPRAGVRFAFGMG
jgi:hypothetical protein